MEHLPAVTIDGGDLTVLHRIAAYTWGSWDVSWPEDYEPPEMDHDRALGFVSKLPGPEGGRFARRFVRADAQIDAENGFTNVEQVLDEAAERTGGDTFFQRDVSPAELGRLVPGLHFKLGDLLPVRVWGGIMRLPVTAIDEATEGGVVVGHTVHLGGQLVSDRGALDAQIAQTEQQIARERRERARQIEEQRQRSNQINRGLTGTDHGDILAAVTGSEGALGTLNQVDIQTNGEVGRLNSEVGNVRRGILGQAQDTQYTTLGGMHEIANVLRNNFLNRYYTDQNDQTRNMLTSSQLAQAEKGLIPAYVAMNNIMWEQQLRVNAVHSNAIQANANAVEALQRAQLSITYIPGGTTATTSDGHLTFDPPTFGQVPQRVRVRRRNRLWRGRIVVLTNIKKVNIGSGDQQIHVGYATDWHMGSNNYADINLGVGDVENIVVIHQTYNPHQL